MNEFIRTTSVPQGTCQHARDRAYAMCDALCERLARESLPLLGCCSVVLCALINMIFLALWRLILTLIVRRMILVCGCKRHTMLPLLVDDRTASTRLR